MPVRGALSRSVTALAVLALAGCTGYAPVEPTLKPPVERPSTPVVAAPETPPVVARPTSEESARLRSYLAQIEMSQLSQGLLRRDGGGVDTPFTADTLARNFEQIAFYNEYGANFTGRGAASPLRRWIEPVRMTVIFGAGVPPSQRNADTFAVRKYAARLSRVTGHPVSDIGAPNFVVIVAGEDDREDALRETEALIPGISGPSLRALRDLRRDTYCAVAAYASGPDSNVYTAAVAVIRAENPDLLRLSCIHEELAQGLGLANDSPAARPSIFNDDDEFALLTRHDELLLQMLYDPRLSPGMRAAEARPTVLGIARELSPGGPV